MRRTLLTGLVALFSAACAGKQMTPAEAQAFRAEAAERQLEGWQREIEEATRRGDYTGAIRVLSAMAVEVGMTEMTLRDHPREDQAWAEESRRHIADVEAAAEETWQRLFLQSAQRLAHARARGDHAGAEAARHGLGLLWSHKQTRAMKRLRDAEARQDWPAAEAAQREVDAALERSQALHSESSVPPDAAVGSSASTAEAAPSAPPVDLSPRPGRSRRPEDVAVVIGIESYSSLPAAHGAELDARTFAQYAERTLGLAPRNVRSLIGQQATRSRIDVMLDDELRRIVRPGSTLYFFFAGHGAPDLQTGKAHLVPWEAEARFISRQGVSLESITRRLGEMRADRVVMLIDACFSGGGRGVPTLLPEGMRPITVERSRAEELPPGPRQLALLTATAEGEVTGTTPDRLHGLFSFYLFRALQGEGDLDGNGAVTLDEVRQWVHDRVADDAAHEGRTQQPSARFSSEEIAGAEIVRFR